MSLCYSQETKTEYKRQGYLLRTPQLQLPNLRNGQNKDSKIRSDGRRRISNPCPDLVDRNGSASSGGENIPVDMKLRPEHGYVYTVSSTLGQRDEESMGDEIPLNRIGVQTKFDQTTS